MKLNDLKYFLEHYILDLDKECGMLVPCSRELKCQTCKVSSNCYNNKPSEGKCILSEENLQYLKDTHPEYFI